MNNKTKWVLISIAIILLYLLVRFDVSMGEGISVEIVEPESVIDITGGGGYAASAPPKQADIKEAVK